MKYKIIIASAISLAISLTALSVSAAFMPPPPPFPTTTDQCKQDNWRSFGGMFKNQGDCVSFVVTNGRNEPDGPPNH